MKYMKTRFIPVHDCHIFVEEEGKGEPLVFIHADSLDHRMWKNQVAYFSKSYRCISIDLRGFGKSSNPAHDPYTFSGDIVAVFKALFLSNVHVVGISLGAAVAIDLALTIPSRIASLVLADPGIEGYAYTGDTLALLQKLRPIAKEHGVEETKKYWKTMPFFAYSKKSIPLWKEIEHMIDETSGYRWTGYNQPLSLSPSAKERVSEITLPTCIIVGMHDIPETKERAEFLHDNLQMSELYILSNVGHLSNMDNPDGFNAIVQQFLSSKLLSNS